MKKLSIKLPARSDAYLFHKVFNDIREGRSFIDLIIPLECIEEMHEYIDMLNGIPETNKTSLGDGETRRHNLYYMYCKHGVDALKEITARAAETGYYIKLVNRHTHWHSIFLSRFGMDDCEEH
jgi:hypothetical protein